jgi:hypothetical protein
MARHGVWIGRPFCAEIAERRRSPRFSRLAGGRGNAVFRAGGANASRRSHDLRVLCAKSGCNAGADFRNESPYGFTSSPFGRHGSHGTGGKVSSVTRSSVATRVMPSGGMWLFVIATAHHPRWPGVWHRRSIGPARWSAHRKLLGVMVPKSATPGSSHHSGLRRLIARLFNNLRGSPCCSADLRAKPVGNWTRALDR